MVARDKLYLFDAGVFRSLRPTGPLDRPGDIDGQALEGLVAQHLRAWAAYSAGDASIFYWRTRGGSEIDFVVYGPNGFHAFEVRNAAPCTPPTCGRCVPSEATTPKRTPPCCTGDVNG